METTEATMSHGVENIGADNVLILGSTYTDLVKVLEISGKASSIMEVETAMRYGSNSTQFANWLLENNLLEEEPHRDIYRAILVEEFYNSKVFTCSTRKLYVLRDDRHVDADFDKPHFVEEVRRQFGNITFSQICIDYFFHLNSWAADNYGKGFFGVNLIQFVTPNEGTPLDPSTCLLKPGGSVFIPFTLGNFKHLTTYMGCLQAVYEVKYWRLDELANCEIRRQKTSNQLHGATELIGPWLHSLWTKTQNQEDTYCKVTAQHIIESGDAMALTNKVLLEAYRKLEEPEEIRFIELKSAAVYAETAPEYCGEYSSDNPLSSDESEEWDGSS